MRMLRKLVHLGYFGRERLLDEDMLAGAKCTTGQREMGTCWSCDNNRINFRVVKDGIGGINCRSAGKVIFNESATLRTRIDNVFYRTIR